MVTEREHFDAVVIGSGFGGSVMAYRLAEGGLSVCVLERGRRYPPGSFARRPQEMRDNFWDPSDGKLGLFQVWDFGEMSGLVSAGLGGGSLIYANVLIRKDERWFVRRRPDGTYDDWPVTREDLDPHYDNVEAMLKPQKYPLDHAPYDHTPKTRALKLAAQAEGVDWLLPDLAVTFGDPEGHPVPGEPIHDASGGTTGNLHGRTRYTCRLCGECDIGCNYGSKNTLDFNYLTEAARLGAQLRDLCEVQAFGPRDNGGFWATYVEHRPGNDAGPIDTRALVSIRLTTDRLVLSAGTFGTNYLLLKNRSNFPGLSDRLGLDFSGNGDFLGLVRRAREVIDGRKRPRLLAPSCGPVITSTIRVPDTRDGGSGPGCYIQDGGYPVLADWLVETSNIGSELRRISRFVADRLLARLLSRPQTELDSQIEELVGNAERSSSMLPLLGMGLDTPGGRMTLDKHRRFLELNWSSGTSEAYFSRVSEMMGRIAGQLGGELQVDPLWYLHKKLITVHPLGGCALGTSARVGVVSGAGEVFGYPRFYIADGSVMPGPVGPNPSLTIAALADRFADHLLR